MKHLLSILDFSVEEIDELINVANDIIKSPEKYSEACKHKQLATLFFEPSTRTRLSFESAMLSLGGSVLGFSSASSSSGAKGESVRDTVAVVSGYVDIIAMRHSKEGAPYVALENALCPIINAGDGGHYHPTQTLADLLTIRHEIGRLNNLTIGICGDLKYGRTVHSLIEAMSRYSGIKFVLVSPDELKLPELVKQKYIVEKGIEYKESKDLESAMPEVDILYMTRIQKERFLDISEYEKLKDIYVLTKDKMSLAKENMIVMHPLPRVNEISVEVDSDKRACYFKQTRYGKYIRMALILKLLKEKDEKCNIVREKAYENICTCKNPHCITTTERETKQLFVPINEEKGEYKCLYCDTPVKIIK